MSKKQPKPEQPRDIIAEANKKLVITTLSVVAVIFVINVLLFCFTPIKTRIAELVESISSESSETVVVISNIAEPVEPTFENRVTELLDALTKSGSLTRAGLGIRYVTITDEIAEKYNLPVTRGAYIPSDDAVIKGMPAQKAGLGAGDIIIGIDNVKIDEKNPLNFLVAKHAVGDSISVTYIRNGQTRVVNIKLAELKVN